VSLIAVSLVALVIIPGGAFAGTLQRKALPDHHLADDAKDIIRLGWPGLFICFFYQMSRRTPYSRAPAQATMSINANVRDAIGRTRSRMRVQFSMTQVPVRPNSATNPCCEGWRGKWWSCLARSGRRCSD
jgi:hypothetical protein